MRALRALAAVATPFDRLRAAAFADLQLYPYQLEPALAAARRLSSRILIADEVGLGKTIQAGLILAELRERGWADRVLVLTPSGLRGQWAEELAQRFDVHAAIMDAVAVRRRAAALPAGINPWTVEPVSIASIDLVKRPEIVQALASIVWDLLLIDEAHLAAAAPQRAAAVRALGERARRIVLLTATPHAGDETAFTSLCNIGRLNAGDPILLFRRTRRDLGLNARRHIRLLPVSLTADELRMHTLVRTYAARLWHEGMARKGGEARLAAIVLTKRALSSASSLARSIERRIETLSLEPERLMQPGLPLRPPGDEQEEEAEIDDADAEPVLSTPGLEDAGDERTCLLEILHAARRAEASERKLRVLCRLLQRAREPVIVFTEYRDTLSRVARELQSSRRLALIHGGLDAGQRRAALDAFNAGRADVLLATDTGGEGLNLHGRCRFVVNLELPWNPMRLEQRIGRVDRIGQSRAVHALHLFARGTAEAEVLARLFQRLERARTAVGYIRDPISSTSDSAIAAAMIDGSPLELAPSVDLSPSSEPLTRSLDLRSDGEAEARRLLHIRQSIPGDMRKWRRTLADDLADLDRAGVLTASVPPQTLRHLAMGTGPALVWIFRARITQSTGQLLEEVVIPLRLPISSDRFARSSREARMLAERLFEQLGGALTSRAEEAAQQRLGQVARLHGSALRLERAREQAIVETLKQGRPVLVQAGLFDGRAIRDHERERSVRTAARADAEARGAFLDASDDIQVARPPELALVIVAPRRCG